MAAGLDPATLGIKLVVETGQTAQRLGSVRHQVVGLQKHVSMFARGLRDTFGGIRQAASGLMLPMAGITAGMALMTREAMKFDTEVRRAGLPFGRDAFPRLRGEIERLAKTAAMELPFTAAETATAIAMMVKAGRTLQESGFLLKPALHIAMTEAMDTGEAMTMLNTTMAKFGLHASKATWAADVLSRASDASQATITTFGESLKYTTAGARALGIDLTNTATALATLAGQGYRGSLAGSQLNRVFFALIDPKKQERLKQMGVTIVDSTGKIKPLRELIIELDKAFSRFSRHRAGSIAFGLFGVRGVQGFQALMNAGVEKFDRIYKVVAEGQMTIAGKGDLLASGFEGLAKRMWASAGVLGTSALEAFGETVRGGLQDAVEFTNEVVRAFEALRQKPWLSDTANEMKDVRRSAYDFAKGLKDAIEKVIPIFRDVWSWIKEIASWLGDGRVRGIVGLAGAFALLSPVIAGFTMTANVLSNVLGGVLQSLIGIGRAAGGMGMLRGGALGASTFGGGGTAVGRAAFTAGLVQKVELVGVAAGVGVMIGNWINSSLEEHEARAENAMKRAMAVGPDYLAFAQREAALSLSAKDPYVMRDLARKGPMTIEKSEQFRIERYTKFGLDHYKQQAMGEWMASNEQQLLRRWTVYKQREELEIRQAVEPLLVAFGETQIGLIRTAKSLEILREYTDAFWRNIAEIFKTNWFKAFTMGAKAIPINITVENRLNDKELGKGIGKSQLEENERRGTQLPPWQRRAIIEHGAIPMGAM